MHRFPNGIDGEPFYQKRVPTQRPPWVQTATITFPSGRHAVMVAPADAAQRLPQLPGIVRGGDLAVGDVAAFVESIERVAAGGTAIDREVVTELVRSHAPRGDRAALEVLTPREREVLALMAEGRTNAAIARDLVVTPGAVEKHISNVFTKLDLPASDDDHRRILAVLTYLRSNG